MVFIRISLLAFLFGGCAGVEETSQRSKPVEATQQIGQQGVGEEVSPEIPGTGPLFVRGAPVLPAPLRVIPLGMDSASARAAVELVRNPEVPLFDSSEGEVELLGGQLPGVEGVGFTIILRKSAVAEIDVSIPAEGARERLTDLWGKGREEDVDGLLAVVWDGADQLQVRLFDLEDEKSVVKFSKHAK
jgi:hypothetical protein